MTDRYLVRICWNTAGWTRPTGDAPQLEGGSYAAASGFGHEEWLFRFEWMFDEWRYGFIEPIRNRLHGRVLDLVLFSIGPAKRRYYIGRIEGVQVLGPDEVRHALTEFERRGWLARMRDEAQAVGGDAGARAFDASRHELFNVRFQAARCEIYDPPRPVRPGDRVLDLHMYHPYAADPEVVAQADRPHPGMDDVELLGPRVRSAVPATLVDEKHRRIQRQLVAVLRREHGHAAATPEVGGVDVLLVVANRTVFFEVKTHGFAKAAIREALGQILEYAIYPPRPSEPLPELVIVAPAPSTPESEEYVARLRTRGVAVRYAQFDETTTQSPL